MVWILVFAFNILVLNIQALGTIPCNEYTCSLDIVILTQRQNNRCDLNCMHAACQYDSSEEESSTLKKENSGCLQICLASNSRCKYEMLGDGKCDECKIY
jgi:hypothetical protein